MVSQTSTLRSRATTCSLVMTSPSGSTMKPEPLPLSVVICTTPDWMRSLSSASDDLLLVGEVGGADELDVDHPCVRRRGCGRRTGREKQLREQCEASVNWHKMQLRTTGTPADSCLHAR